MLPPCNGTPGIDGNRAKGEHRGPSQDRLSEMWLRDFRSAFKTRLTDAGVPRDTIEALLGHRGGFVGCCLGCRS